MIEKNLAFKSYCCSNRNMFLLEKFKALQYQLHISIEESKEKYYTKWLGRLANPLTSPKTYWSILKTFLNNKKKKILVYLLFFKKTNSSRTSNEKLNFLTIFLSINTSFSVATASYLQIYLNSQTNALIQYIFRAVTLLK